MMVPKSFYVRFWLNNSTMAVATGFVIGLMLARLVQLFFFALATPIFALVVYQFAVYKYFVGKRRGHFEYAYQEHLLRKALDSLVIKILGFRAYLRLYMDELSALGNVREDIYKSLEGSEEIIQNDGLRFYLYVRIAESALKESSFDRECGYLRKAVSIRPNDLVANYRLGNSLERAGDGTGAVRAYEAALKNAVIDKELSEVILDQIKRVEKSGPAKSPPHARL
jgi:tetratricopeptide (TPR) repeat protein